MKMTFRWYGDIRSRAARIHPPDSGNVRDRVGVYDVPVGEVWPVENIQALKAKIEAHGLTFDVVESVPVHEDIKLGKPSATG